MKSRSFFRTLLLMGLAALILFACQSKEVTSARVYIQQENWEKAIEQLEAAVESNPADAEAAYLLGWGYAERGDWAGMKEMFDKSLAAGSKFSKEINMILDQKWVETFNSGVKLIGSEDLDGAAAKFREAVNIDVKRPEAYANLAITLIRANKLTDAIDVYNQLLAIQPDNVKAMNELSRLYMQAEKYQEAVETAEKTLAIEPDNADGIYNLALGYDYLGESDKARAQYEKALANNPDDFDLTFNVARIYFVSGDFNKAIELFQRVIQANPDDYESNLNVGNAYLSMADEMRKTLIQKERDGKEVSEDEMNQMKKLYEQSIPYLEKAIEKNSTDANIWTNLGVAYVNIGDAIKGKECFDKAEALNP